MLGQDAQFLSIPLSTISGVANQTCKKLENLDLHSYHDMIFNLPFRYEDHTYIQTLKQPRAPEDAANIVLTIVSPPQAHGQTTEFKAQDPENTYCRLIFFHAPSFILERLTVGTKVLAWGKIRISFFNGFTVRKIVHPQIQFIDHGQVYLPTKLSPVYHLTAGLTQERLRRIGAEVLQQLTDHPLPEVLPSDLNPFHISLNDALLDVHNPLPHPKHLERKVQDVLGYQRICFEELVAYHLSIMSLRAQQTSKNAPLIVYHPEVQQQLLSTLPFTPTSAQNRVFHEIMSDCGTNVAMNRLVHGDVGSGKTLIAAMSMLQVAANNYQTALLAPTELLAQQHQRKLNQLFAPLGIEVALVTGSLKKKERDQVFEQAKSGSVKIFVGTHALFQAQITYKHLALVIVDEQHRFGVDQREALLNKAPHDFSAHELLMTATPIPRSLQQILFADSTVSTIDVMPAGRSPITTAVLRQNRDQEVIERLRDVCSKGEQAYWVCPLIEENEMLEANSAKERYKNLCESLPELKIGLLHAQLKEKERTATMLKFIHGELNILVATTIIEVGVDVPNATIMIIESADRLGLAQLHQLRGRVGRGSKQSFCLLLHKDRPDPEFASPTELERYERGIQRLTIMRNSTDGFTIANEDLRLRGPGEYFGTNQTGKENLRFANLERDLLLSEQARNAARTIFTTNAPMTDQLIWRWFPAVFAALKAAKEGNEEPLQNLHSSSSQRNQNKKGANKKTASTSGNAQQQNSAPQKPQPQPQPQPKQIDLDAYLFSAHEDAQRDYAQATAADAAAHAANTHTTSANNATTSEQAAYAGHDIIDVTFEDVTEENNDNSLAGNKLVPFTTTKV